ncbi:UNVERIFIED_CONTAM: hypothetical protein RF653_15150 [Kocuria sp. CPCC 205316]
MMVIGTIRPHEVKEIEAEGADYDQARQKLLTTIPDGYTLLNVRRG